MERNSPVGSLRADAARNRQRVLEAAAEVFADRGVDAPMDEIARRAGVGNATLYRRFPDRELLMREVALDVLRRGTQSARAALAEEPDAFAALSRYLREALQTRVGAIMPVLARVVARDEEFVRLRDEGAKVLGAIMQSAHRDGTLRADVTFGDIGPMLTRLSRPMVNSLSEELDRQLADRQLQIVLAGMRAVPGQEPLTGPALNVSDLRSSGLSRTARRRRGASNPS